MEIKYGEHELRHGLPSIADDDGTGKYRIVVISNVVIRMNRDLRDWVFRFRSKPFDDIDEAGNYIGEFRASLPKSITVPVDGSVDEDGD